MEPIQPENIESKPETTATASADSVPQADLTPRADAEVASVEATVTHQDLAEWRGRDLLDRNGERIGKLEEVYFDVETDEPQFGTVKEGLFGHHLALVPLAGATIRPDSLQVLFTKAQIKDAPEIGPSDLSQADESRLYHHYQLNYSPREQDNGRRLARR